ncbi:MAG: N,N-dimethylformamidase [Dehalococcoidia bacterium]|nr:N,N-dimethylformamidase [Dehalococcoidia bacterium]|tara:strand:- start:2338 stop:3921 length:1584 start_codon:yes stop_codon:yes gene_type:complete
MLIGYISDERYLSIPDAQVEFINSSGESFETRSRASGSVYADLPKGKYDIIIAKSGFGSKRVSLDLPLRHAHHFRLLPEKIIGYSWPKSIKSGQFSEFRIHSPEAYKLTLWRYGLNRELIRPVGWFDEHGPRATVQVSPDNDYTQKGIQWNTVGYTSPDHKQYIEGPPESGLYYFHVNGESGEFFSFPWVIAPSEPKSKIAVLCSDLNWNAYNNFGGRSNYIHPEGLPEKPTVYARSELLRYTQGTTSSFQSSSLPQSLDRPELINLAPENTNVSDPIEGRAASHLAPAEWRLLAWLEKEGFAHDVYSETQLHADTLNLDSYKVLILGPHPEYWTSKMYYKVKAWVHEKGGRLMYLGGNGINAEVELLESSAMVVHNFPADYLSKEKFESRFHARNESEANLLGVVYDNRGIMTAAPYEVKNANHWALEGTGLSLGELFGTESQHMRIPGGASGHETDKISPRFSPHNIELIAKGMNPDDGGADMTVYEVPSGGAVFSAGSICYVSSLFWDKGVSAVTSNVLKRFLR